MRTLLWAGILLLSFGCVICREIQNPHEFYYLKNPAYRVCGGQENGSPTVDLLVYVHTSPNNLKRRIAIRETWARRSMFANTRLVFMLGDTANQTVSSLLELEHNTYGDLVQENFVDSYKNITYKCVMAFRWISTYCSNARLVLKTDDDVIVNTFAIVRTIQKLTRSVDSIICRGWTYGIVNRNINSKWYVSKSEFEPARYGKYCSGFFLIFTGTNGLMSKMYNESYYHKFFWVDDYFMTGIVAKSLNVTLEFRNDAIFQYPYKTQGRFYNDHVYTTLALHTEGNLNLMNHLWKHVLKAYTIETVYDNVEFKRLFEALDALNQYRIDLFSIVDYEQSSTALTL